MASAYEAAGRNETDVMGEDSLDVLKARRIEGQSSVVDDPQNMAGEEAQLAPDDDGAQVRRPAEPKQAGKPAKRGK